MPTEVVTVFLRHETDVLLLQRSADVGSYPGQWGAVAGHVEDEPAAQARVEIAEETSLEDAVTFVRRGDPFEVTDADHGTWVVHPFLFDCDSRDVETNWETERHEWVPPTEILERDTVPDLWRSYDAVRPTVETVAEDDEHGSTYVSLRALDVLRDEATVAADGDSGWRAIADVARSLLDARPSMAVVRNRVNRAMANADPTPAGVEAAAREVANEAVDADARAAAEVAAEIRGVDATTVFTLSRSGTVTKALADAAVDRVLVAESRPGGEGVDVAEALASDFDVTLTTDANVPAAVAEADRVLVGADAIFPDGSVVNKVGTRAAALAARDTDVPIFVVCAADKIAPEPLPVETDGREEDLYDGDALIDVRNPVFEVVPAALVDAVVTERGRLDAEAVRELAAEHRDWTDWDSASGGE